MDWMVYVLFLFFFFKWGGGGRDSPVAHLGIRIGGLDLDLNGSVALVQGKFWFVPAKLQGFPVVLDFSIKGKWLVAYYGSPEIREV